MSGTHKTARVLYAFLILTLMFVYKLSSLELSIDDNLNNLYSQDQSDLVDQDLNLKISEEKIIGNIIISGNYFVSTETILSRLPYSIGDIFNKNLSGEAIRNIYSLGYFTNPIEIYEEYVDDKVINLHIFVKEKIKLSGVEYKGNSNIKSEDIEKKVKLSEVVAIDSQELNRYSCAIKKLYAEKSFHSVIITPDLSINKNNTATAIFNISEGRKSIVKRVFFEGNKCVPSKKLRAIIFTREDWLFSMLDKAGTYHPDAIEQDKYTIENFYQSSGFLSARVINVNAVKDPKSCSFDVTFFIEEGPIYTVTKVSAPGNDTLSEDEILARVPVKVGQLYSRDLIRKSLDNLKLLWGEYGYIYADIEPNIQPDHDKKTVTIEFNSELGSKFYLNRILIKGNKKTCDNVIRRRLLLDEGEILTNYKMDESKKLVESLGFFDQRDGVNWRTQRIQEDLADLELIVKEIKTGKLYAQASYGGVDKTNPSVLSSLKLGIGFSDRNFLGTGVSYDLQASVSREEKNIGIVISNPWLFNKPILGAISIFHKQAIYEDMRNVQPVPVEFITGGVLTTGFRSERIARLQLNYDLGFQNVHYQCNPKAFFENPVSDEIRNLYQFILDRQFQAGELLWINQTIMQDSRNNPIFPTRGNIWSIASKAGTGTRCTFGFLKLDIDGVFYTPLIGEYDLIFALHGHLGAIANFKNRTVPYRELYHIGGPTTVRGYVPGELGPSISGDSIGATKALYFNAELIFPITEDAGMKGRFFYDGGSGWGFLKDNCIDAKLIKNNTFNYRHSIGFGLQMIRPQPIRIDWGFKLDRNKRRGEKAYEISFSMSQDFW